jgi:hypothetical protein
VNARAQIACVQWKEWERTSPSRSERAGVDSPSAVWFSPPPLVSVCVCLCRSSQLLLPVPSTVALRDEGRAMRAGTTWMKRHQRTQTDKNGEELLLFLLRASRSPGIDVPRPLRGCCIDRSRSPFDSFRFCLLRSIRRIRFSSVFTTC